MPVPYIDFNRSPDFSLRTISWQGMDIAGYSQYYRPAISELYMPQHCISIVVAGEKKIYTPRHCHNMQAGDILFLPRGSYFLSEILWQQGQYESLVIMLPDKLLQSLYIKYLKHSPTLQQPSKVVLKDEQFDNTVFLKSWINSFLPYFSAGNTYSVLQEIKIHELLLHLLLNDRSGIISQIIMDANRAESRKLENVIDQYFRYKMTHEELAALAGISLSGFKRECYKKYNMAPGEIILNKRMELAAFQLSFTSKPVTEIVEECGYESCSHFIQVFRKFYNISPARYRKALSQERYLLN